MNLVDEFENNNLSIGHVALLDYITEPLSPGDALNDVFDDIDEKELIRLFGEKVARSILDNDPDIAAYLKEDVGGVFIKAYVRLPYADSVEFDQDGTPKSWYLAPYMNILYAVEPSTDDAIKVLIQKAKKMKQAVFDEALAAKGGRNNGDQ